MNLSTLKSLEVRRNLWTTPKQTRLWVKKSTSIHVQMFWLIQKHCFRKCLRYSNPSISTVFEYQSNTDFQLFTKLKFGATNDWNLHEIRINFHRNRFNPEIKLLFSSPSDKWDVCTLSIPSPTWIAVLLMPSNHRHTTLIRRYVWTLFMFILHSKYNFECLNY